MKLLHIVLIACGGALLLLILIIIGVSLSNRRKTKKLDENLKKYQKANQDFDNESRVVISDDKPKEQSEPVVEEYRPEVEVQEQEPVVEEYKPEIRETGEVNFEEFASQQNGPTGFDDKIKFEFEPDEDSQPNLSPEELDRKRRQKRDGEFEKFMNEHAYSRKILDKKMIDKIKKLPPEIKAMLLTSVFDKFDDNK